MSNSSVLPETGHPISPGGVEFILSAVDRLDCALTAFGCLKMELDNDPDNDDASEVQAIHWIYDILREEARNIRGMIAMAQGKRFPPG